MFNSEPSEFGEVSFKVDRKPISMQSKGHRKEEYKEYIREIIKSSTYLFSGDVQVDITWHIHEENRYEESSAIDTDNIIKPLLDAISGIQGLLIDDTQVQSISCHWLDNYNKDDEYVEITIKSLPDDFILKKDLLFIEYSNHLCLPFKRDWEIEFQKTIVHHWETMLNMRDELIESGLSYYDSKAVMPIQRVFHKSKLSDFEIISKEEIKKQLEENT